MSAPKHYSDWVHLLYQLKESGQEDGKIVSILEEGKLEWTPGVADKIVSCTFEVIEHKLKFTTHLFQQEINHSQGEEAALISAIINARNRFNLIYRLCRLAIFPDEVRESLENTVSKYIEDSQKALLKSAKYDQSGQLSYLIRNNSLIQKQDQAPVSATREYPDQNQSSERFKSKRRVLF